MVDWEITMAVLLEGAIGGTVLSVLAFLLSRFSKDIFGRSLLVIFLFIAAGAYFGFATIAAPGSIWLFIEILGVIVFGSMALLGWRGSPYWVATAWALHPLWDAWHLFGAGRFTPEFYAIACFSFDLLVAAFIVVLYELELLESAQSRFEIV